MERVKKLFFIAISWCILVMVYAAGGKIGQDYVHEWQAKGEFLKFFMAPFLVCGVAYSLIWYIGLSEDGSADPVYKKRVQISTIIGVVFLIGSGLVIGKNAFSEFWQIAGQIASAYLVMFIALKFQEGIPGIWIPRRKIKRDLTTQQ